MCHSVDVWINKLTIMWARRNERVKINEVGCAVSKIECENICSNSITTKRPLLQSEIGAHSVSACSTYIEMKIFQFKVL